MGSTTLGGTIVTLLSTLGLASPVILGFGLVLLWLLSPLGGQASLYLLSTADIKIPGSHPFRYLDTEIQRSALTGYHVPSYLFDSIFATPLLDALNQHTSMDNWGNIKVFIILSLPVPVADPSRFLPWNYLTLRLLMQMDGSLSQLTKTLLSLRLSVSRLWESRAKGSQTLPWSLPTSPLIAQI